MGWIWIKAGRHTTQTMSSLPCRVVISVGLGMHLGKTTRCRRVFSWTKYVRGRLSLVMFATTLMLYYFLLDTKVRSLVCTLTVPFYGVLAYAYTEDHISFALVVVVVMLHFKPLITAEPHSCMDDTTHHTMLFKKYTSVHIPSLIRQTYALMNITYHLPSNVISSSPYKYKYHVLLLDAAQHVWTIHFEHTQHKA